MKWREIDSELKRADASLANARKFLTNHNYADAEPLLEESIQLKVQALGPNHPDLVPMRELLGDVYFGNNKLDRSSAAYNSLLEEGADEPIDQRIRLRLKMAKISEKAGETEFALAQYQAAITNCQHDLAPGHPLTALLTESYARLLRRAQKAPELIRAAEEMAGEARKNCLPSAHLSGMELFRRSSAREPLNGNQGSGERKPLAARNITFLLYPLVLLGLVAWLWFIFGAFGTTISANHAGQEQSLYTVANDFTDNFALIKIRSSALLLLIGCVVCMTFFFGIVLKTTRPVNQMLFPTLLLGLLFICALIPAPTYAALIWGLVPILFMWLWYMVAVLYLKDMKHGPVSRMVCHTCGAEDYACKAPSESNLVGNLKYWKNIMERHQARGDTLLWFDTFETLSRQNLD